MSESELNVCRACLNINGRMHSIMNTRYREMYARVTNQQLELDRGCPDTMCYVCMSEVRRFHKFIEMSRKAELALRTLLLNKTEVNVMMKLKKAHTLLTKQSIESFGKISSRNMKVTTVELISILSEVDDEPEVVVSIEPCDLKDTELTGQAVEGDEEMRDGTTQVDNAMENESRASISSSDIVRPLLDISLQRSPSEAVSSRFHPPTSHDTNNDIGPSFGAPPYAVSICNMDNDDSHKYHNERIDAGQKSANTVDADNYIRRREADEINKDRDEITHGCSNNAISPSCAGPSYTTSILKLNNDDSHKYQHTYKYVDQTSSYTIDSDNYKIFKEFDDINKDFDGTPVYVIDYDDQDEMDARSVYSVHTSDDDTDVFAGESETDEEMDDEEIERLRSLLCSKQIDESDDSDVEERANILACIERLDEMHEEEIKATKSMHKNLDENNENDLTKAKGNDTESDIRKYIILKPGCSRVFEPVEDDLADFDKINEVTANTKSSGIICTRQRAEARVERYKNKMHDSNIEDLTVKQLENQDTLDLTVTKKPKTHEDMDIFEPLLKAQPQDKKCEVKLRATRSKGSERNIETNDKLTEYDSQTKSVSDNYITGNKGITQLLQKVSVNLEKLTTETINKYCARNTTNTPGANESRAHSDSDNEYNTSNELLVAMNSTTVEEKMRSRKCTLCDFTTDIKQVFRQHTLDHNNKYKYSCAYCAHHFRSLVTLRDHNKHNCNKCDICNRTFAHHNYMKKHIKTHYRSKGRTKCEFCSKDFSLKSHLTKHINKIHKSEMNRPTFTCIVCLKEYLSAEALKGHMKKHDYKLPRIHERKFELFFKKNISIVHNFKVKSGRDERSPYTCDICYSKMDFKNILR